MATSTTDPTGVSLDLTRNRDVHGPLGPFDSKVTALVHVDGESYFIVTNADYIPALPIKEAQTIFLREDMRYGEDDPTLWPQNYSTTFCHLGAIRRKPVGDKRAISIMWWNPTPNDFVCHDSGLTGSRGLGRLIWDKISQLSAPVKQFMDDYKTARPQLKRVHEMLDALVQQLRLGLERLETLPSTYTQMQVAVTALQQTFLEADGLFRYMTVYKPRMDIAPNGPPPAADHCVGVFTTQPVIAQQFRAAGLPYWFLRPTWTFTNEKLLEVVELREPAHYLVLESAPGATHIRTKPDTDSKITTIHRCSRFVPWYKDPFASSVEEEPDSIASSIDGPSSSAQRLRLKNRDVISLIPLSRPIPAVRRERIPVVELVEVGAAEVVVVAEVATKRFLRELETVVGMVAMYCLSLHLWSVGGSRSTPALPTSSEHDDGRVDLSLGRARRRAPSPIFAAVARFAPGRWCGTADGQARTADENSARSVAINEVLGAAFRACNLTAGAGFPAPPGSFPLITNHRAQELLWVVAETNFRFEFLALDRRASQLDRPDECRECFAGGMLMGMPVELAKQGLASMSPRARLPFIKRIAKLMRKWEPRPESAAIAQAQDRQEWDDAAMGEIEAAVAKHYTQTFYEYFGRAAVVPMRLVHEFGT
ncbi:hypothetical protein K438DRAFT_1994054 [Mycena galopus ATCC 62051]|nr:hypothetical protein K438DRAFT_1994054 [Mycena galopus ATCC 62051]